MDGQVAGSNRTESAQTLTVTPRLGNKQSQDTAQSFPPPDLAAARSETGVVRNQPILQPSMVFVPDDGAPQIFLWPYAARSRQTEISELCRTPWWRDETFRVGVSGWAIAAALHRLDA